MNSVACRDHNKIDLGTQQNSLVPTIKFEGLDTRLTTKESKKCPFTATTSRRTKFLKATQQPEHFARRKKQHSIALVEQSKVLYFIPQKSQKYKNPPRVKHFANWGEIPHTKF